MSEISLLDNIGHDDNHASHSATMSIFVSISIFDAVPFDIGIVDTPSLASTSSSTIPVLLSNQKLVFIHALVHTVPKNKLVCFYKSHFVAASIL